MAYVIDSMISTSRSASSSGLIVASRVVNTPERARGFGAHHPLCLHQRVATAADGLHGEVDGLRVFELFHPFDTGVIFADHLVGTEPSSGLPLVRVAGQYDRLGAVNSSRQDGRQPDTAGAHDEQGFVSAKTHTVVPVYRTGERFRERCQLGVESVGRSEGGVRGHRHKPAHTAIGLLTHQTALAADVVIPETQKGQNPQRSSGSTPTRSPSLTCATPVPTAVTVPANSCPVVIPGRGKTHRGNKCKSDPQMPTLPTAN